MPPLPTLASLEWSTACQTSPPPSLGLPLILAAAFPFGRMSGGARARLSRTLEPNYVWHWSLRNWVSHSDCRRRPRCLDGETIHGLQALKDFPSNTLRQQYRVRAPGLRCVPLDRITRTRFFSAKTQRGKEGKACLLGGFAPLRLGAPDGAWPAGKERLNLEHGLGARNLLRRSHSDWVTTAFNVATS
jgi:hypothetical protein